MIGPHNDTYRESVHAKLDMTLYMWAQGIGRLNGSVSHQVGPLCRLTSAPRRRVCMRCGALRHSQPVGVELTAMLAPIGSAPQQGDRHAYAAQSRLLGPTPVLSALGQFGRVHGHNDGRHVLLRQTVQPPIAPFGHIHGHSDGAFFSGSIPLQTALGQFGHVQGHDDGQHVQKGRTVKPSLGRLGHIHGYCVVVQVLGHIPI